MSRYKGRQSAKAVEQDFPHYVDVVVPEGDLGMKLNAMYDFLDTAFKRSAVMGSMMLMAALFGGASPIGP